MPWVPINDLILYGRFSSLGNFAKNVYWEPHLIPTHLILNHNTSFAYLGAQADYCILLSE